MPKISAVGLFSCHKFEETPKQKVIDLSKLKKFYFSWQMTFFAIPLALRMTIFKTFKERRIHFSGSLENRKFNWRSFRGKPWQKVYYARSDNEMKRCIC